MANKKRKKTATVRKRASKPVRRAKISKTITPTASADTLNALLSAARRDPDDVRAGLELATYYLFHNQEEQIVEAIERLETAYPFPDDNLSGWFDRLLALGYADAGRLIEAEAVISRGLARDETNPDFHYVNCYVSMRLKEYSKAAEAGEQYFRLIASAGSPSARSDLTVSDAHRSQLHNLLGSAYQQLKREDQAVEQFVAAIEIDDGNHLPYLNLCRLYRRQQQSDLADQFVQRGLKACRQIQELRLLHKSWQGRVSISACMIVKDEEKLLPGCLDSIRDWVDEIIIVDTGSTDRTIEIAKTYGAKVYHQAWEGNFSKHRNHSMEQATSDWIFIIDADERMFSQDVPLIYKILGEDKYPIISINVYNVYGKNEQTVTFLPSVRFFKRQLEMRYSGIVHNRLEYPDNVAIARTQIRLKHLGYDLSKPEMAKKFQRSKLLLEKQLEENPDNAFALFNYAQLLRGDGDSFPLQHAEKIIECAARAVKITDTDNIHDRSVHLMCLDQIAWTRFHQKDYESAIEHCERALKIRPDYLDPLLLLGHIYSQLKDLPRAAKHYNRYLETQASYDPTAETDNLILVHLKSRATAYYGLGVVAELQAEFESAVRYLNEAIKAHPGYLNCNTILGRLALVRDNFVEAKTYFQNQIDHGQTDVESLLGLAQIAGNEASIDTAAEFFEQAVKLAPDDPDALVKYGQFCLANGLTEKAEDLFQSAAGMGEADEQIRRTIADAYFKQGNFPKATELYTALHRNDPENAEIVNDLGNCYYKRELYPEAEKWYLVATEAKLSPSIAWRNLGLTLARLDKSRESIAALERYLEVNPNEARLYQVIGDQQIKLGDFISAISLYEKALAANPLDPLTLFSLSECYLHMGHTDSALLGYQRVLDLDPDFEPAKRRLAEPAASPVAT